MLLKVDVHHELGPVSYADDIASLTNAELRTQEGRDQAGQTCRRKPKLPHLKPFDD